MPNIDRLRERLKEIDNKIGVVISNADKKVAKLEKEAEKIEQKIEKYESK